jgi:DNA-binding FadR family transcriptional regulator
MLTEGARDGSLQPGSKLPTERALVDQLGAPRSAVRRALEVLERDGVIVREVGRGTFLTDVAVAQVAGAPADTSPAEIMQARLLIEPRIAALAAQVATQADLDRIGSALGAGGGCVEDDFEGFESWDGKLHRGIAVASHNGLLVNVFDVLHTARALPVWGTLKRRTSTPERRRRYHEEHTAIVAALHDRDATAAAAAMSHHLHHVSEALVPAH